MASVSRGGTIRLTAQFYEYAGGPAYDPTEEDGHPELNIHYGSTLEAGPLLYSSGAGALQRASTGSYYYDYLVPNDAGLGSWRASWDGTIHGAEIHGDEYFEVAVTGSVNTGPGSDTTLSGDFELLFTSGADPLYIDPDEIIILFPDASYVEILELISIYSTEVYDILNGGELTQSAYEYIRAAVGCALSRIYDFGSFGGDNSITLGDFTVRSATISNGNKTSRGNATTWCELAEILRADFVRGTKHGMKAIVKGSDYVNPMPNRSIGRNGCKCKTASHSCGRMW